MPIPFHAIPTLALLTAEQQAALAPTCTLRAYERGETIFSEGERAERIHFLYLGRVKIVKAVGEREVIIEILGSGEPLGAVAVYERRPYPATAVAMETSSVVSVAERDFFQLIESEADFTRRLLSGLTMRLMALNKRLADMTGTVEQRTARFFLTLSERIGANAAGEIEFPLSRQEIADIVGTTIESAIRLMTRWQREKIVSTHARGFTIIDRERLEAIAQADES